MPLTLTPGTVTVLEDGTIDGSADIDYYAVELNAGDHLTVLSDPRPFADPLTSLPPGLALYDENGTFIGANTGDGNDERCQRPDLSRQQAARIC